MRSIGVLIVTGLLALSIGCRTGSTLPVLFHGPDFDLTDQTGRPFGSADLGGHVVLANFIFTSCTDVCPLLTATMAQVRDRLRPTGLLGGKVVLVSFSVDPQHDTPEILAEYGERFGAVPTEWRLLNGDQAAIDALMIGGFKVGRPMLRPRVPGGVPEINHTSRFVLLDARWQARALLSGDILDVPAVVEEIRRLAA
ncbi:MAG: SCO family protein [Chloroflexota bacterium]